MTRRRRRARRSSTSTTTAAARSGRTAGWRPPSVRWFRGCQVRPALPNGTRPRTSGSSTTSRQDFSEADDLAAKDPSVSRSCRRRSTSRRRPTRSIPLGAGIWLRLHPEDRIKTPYTHWRFDATTTRMPEFTAPGLGRENNTVTIDAEIGDNASGVLYALGGAGGGLALYMDKGQLVYEYNMMIIERYDRALRNKGCVGQASHRGDHDAGERQAAVPADVVLKVDGQEVARTTVQAYGARARSRPARRSTSAWISARPSRSTTSTGGHSGSTARSARSRCSWTSDLEGNHAQTDEPAA